MLLIITLGTTTTGQDVPDVKELNKKIVPVCAPKWRELGEELGLLSHELDTISMDHAYHPRHCEESCKVVLRKWLEKDLTASWNKLHAAMNSISSNTVETIAKGIPFICINITSCICIQHMYVYSICMYTYCMWENFEVKNTCV